MAELTPALPDQTRCWSCPVKPELELAYHHLYELVWLASESHPRDIDDACKDIEALLIERHP